MRFLRFVCIFALFSPLALAQDSAPAWHDALDDDAGDVRVTSGSMSGARPEPDPSTDIVRVESRLDDGHLVGTVTLAASAPEDLTVNILWAVGAREEQNLTLSHHAFFGEAATTGHYQPSDAPDATPREVNVEHARSGNVVTFRVPLDELAPAPECASLWRAGTLREVQHDDALGWWSDDAERAPRACETLAVSRQEAGAPDAEPTPEEEREIPVRTPPATATQAPTPAPTDGAGAPTRDTPTLAAGAVVAASALVAALAARRRR